MEKATGYRLRGLAGGETRSKARPFEARAVETLSLSVASRGSGCTCGTRTPAGYDVAAAELGLPLHAPRIDIGAQSAEHFALLIDLLVQLLQPRLGTGASLRDLRCGGRSLGRWSCPASDRRRGRRKRPVLRLDASAGLLALSPAV
jgi:hypothetical protein